MFWEALVAGITGRGDEVYREGERRAWAEGRRSGVNGKDDLIKEEKKVDGLGSTSEAAKLKIF